MTFPCGSARRPSRRSISSLETEHLFPVAVSRYRVDDHVALNRALERRVRKIRKREPLWKGQQRPWQCHPNLHLDPVFEPLLTHIRAAITSHLQHMRYDLDGWDFTGMWANLLVDGDFHPPHAHANNLLSGAYYVCSPAPEASGIRFLSPNRGALSPKLTEFVHQNSGVWNFPAEEGTGLIFPSWLQHYVPQVRGGERISIAWNVMAKGSLDVPESLEYSRIS